MNRLGRRYGYAGFTTLTALLLIGCGSTKAAAPKELVDARAAYNAAASGPAAQYNPSDLHVAKTSLDRAEQWYAQDPGAAETRTQSYLALRQGADRRGAGTDGPRDRAARPGGEGARAGPGAGARPDARRSRPGEGAARRGGAQRVRGRRAGDGGPRAAGGRAQGREGRGHHAPRHPALPDGQVGALAVGTRAARHGGRRSQAGARQGHRRRGIHRCYGQRRREPSALEGPRRGGSRISHLARRPRGQDRREGIRPHASHREQQDGGGACHQPPRRDRGAERRRGIDAGG